MGSNTYADVVGPEQLCYIPCNFCNIVLAVSVPYSSFFDIVTVRCGHCSNLWSVNMAAAFQSALSWQDLHHPHHQIPKVPNYYLNGLQDYRLDQTGTSSKVPNKIAVRGPAQKPTEERIVNRPPVKKQRVPSAYNQFIKEEIQRIKANNPDITHREAFSTAAKNWAHFPHIHFGLMLEPNNNNQTTKFDQNNAGKRFVSMASGLMKK